MISESESESDGEYILSYWWVLLAVTAVLCIHFFGSFFGLFHLPFYVGADGPYLWKSLFFSIIIIIYCSDSKCSFYELLEICKDNLDWMN